MSLAKVIEVLAEGSTIEKAMESAVEEASRSVHNIRGVYLKDVQAIVKDDAIAKYRVNVNITFVIEH